MDWWHKAPSYTLHMDDHLVGSTTDRLLARRYRPEKDLDSIGQDASIAARP